MQMTTDTAVRVTRMIIQRRGEAWIHQRFIHELDSWHEPIPVPVPLAEIKYADNPQIRINKHETTEMPFRYMVDDDLMPIMPQVGPPVIVLLRITCKWRSDFVTKMLNVNFYTLGDDWAHTKGFRKGNWWLALRHARKSLIRSPERDFCVGAALLF